MDPANAFILGLTFGFVAGFGLATFALTMHDDGKTDSPAELDHSPEHSQSARLFIFDTEPITYTWDESLGAWVSQDGKHKVTPDDRRDPSKDPR